MQNDNDSQTPAALSMPAAAFRDKAFRSRTVVFPDGGTAAVEQGRVAVTMPEHIAFLEQHAGFERVGRADGDS
ncbi:hypothetical protein LFL96_04925 [Paraburkholderia sp. D15]|uniref:hypothetical protein n=1 Tax=Paraburkholderia sp. D15 TaxID=2880218 RepID=UPI002478FA67|nr:hypothetical protein [Paraburkholderia sp. D15]WGS50849.1 hypothetical protein LFL96_04925 [Paraburkholderia sp. D15]